MAYTYARRKPSRRHWPKLLAVAVVCFPWSLARLDFRTGFSRGLDVSVNRSSPAFAALEDVTADFSVTVDDVAETDLPLLGAPERAVPIERPQIRQLALEGSIVRRPAPVEGKIERAVAAADAPVADLYADPENDRSLERVAARLVRRELAAANPERVIASALGTKIIVRGNASAHAPRSTHSAALVAFKPNFKNVSGEALPDRTMWLDGSLEMTGGLAFTGDDVQMIVKRTLDGRTLEKGRIWITEGRFEIQVSRPTGQLVAELRTRDGRIVGRGELNLLSLGGTPATDQTRIGDLRIALRPTTEIASVRAISAYSHRDHKIGLPEARVEIQSVSQALRVDDEGFAAEPELGRGSTFLARAEVKGHRPSLAIGRAADVRDIRLMSNRMVEALVELERKPQDRERAKLQAIVWGSILERGQAVAGATVETTSGLEPIYFNDLYLPDRNLTATSANGLFAFLDVPSGVQAVRVSRGERSYPAQVFATEDQHVSVVDFDLNDEAIARFRVEDVFDGNKPRAADLKLVGTEAHADVAGDAAIRFASSGGTMMVEADAGPEFETSRANVASDGSDVHVPLVKREWIETLFATRGLRPRGDRGTIVGFVDDRDFQVEMTGLVLDEKLNVVYFDRDGKTLERPNGTAGGGFAILDAPAGLQTVRITPLPSRESYAQVVVAEPNLVHVMTWSPAER